MKEARFSSIQPVDRALSSATTPGQSGPGSDGNEGVLCIPQSSSIAGTSPSDCLVSYQGHSLLVVGVLSLCREAVGVFYSPSWLGKVAISEANASMKFCDVSFFQFSYFPCQVVIRSFALWLFPSEKIDFKQRNQSTDNQKDFIRHEIYSRIASTPSVLYQMASLLAYD